MLFGRSQSFGNALIWDVRESNGKLLVLDRINAIEIYEKLLFVRHSTTKVVRSIPYLIRIVGLKFISYRVKSKRKSNISRERKYDT